MKPNRHIKAFRYGVDKFPRWMSYYVENRRFITTLDGSYSWATIQDKHQKSVVHEGDWVVEIHYKLKRFTHEEFVDQYQQI